MAKKTATELVAATTPPVPKSTKKTIPSIPCALKYYWQFALIAWGYCLANLTRFTAKSTRFTSEFIETELAYIRSTKDLPTRSTRNSLSREVLLSLMAARQAVSDQAIELGGAIAYTFKDAALIEVQRTAAGLTDFAAATPSDWGAVSTFITTANNYLTANARKLVEAGAVNEGFATDFESVGTAFSDIWDDLVAKRQNATDGTQAVANRIKRIKQELDPMMKLGRNTIFKYEPELRQLFTKGYVVSKVRSGHPASIKGRTNWFDAEKPKGGKPIAGLLVEVLGEEGKSAITDKLGRYKIGIAAGEYTVRYSGEAVTTFEKQVTVEAGVEHRVNVLLEPAPVAEAFPPIVAPTPMPDVNALTESLREVGMVNGVQ